MAQRSESGAESSTRRGTSAHIAGMEEDSDTSAEDVAAYQAAQQQFERYTAFITTRVESGDGRAWQRSKGRKYASRKTREARGKQVLYHKQDTATQHSLDQSRAKEWANWKRFQASCRIGKAEGDEILNRLGLKAVPTQWIETDRSEPKRVPGGPEIPPEHKSRLVGRGDLDTFEERSDSPTIDAEGENLIYSFAASNRLRIKMGDLQNGYFQGKKLTRPIILKQLKGGIPDPEYGPEDYMMAQVPIYGFKAAGRGLWKQMRDMFVGAGLKENFVMKALYSYTDDKGKILAMLGSHVDDCVYANEPEAEHIIQKAKEAFQWGKEEAGSFRFNGKEIHQHEDFSISKTCKDNTLKLQQIFIDAKVNGKTRRNQDSATEGEKAQLKSVNGGLSWIARQCRPTLDYRVSKLKKREKDAKVADLKECNQLGHYAQEHAENHKSIARFSTKITNSIAPFRIPDLRYYMYRKVARLNWHTEFCRQRRSYCRWVC